MNHELKIEEPFYIAVKEGRKTFEIRRNDRGFQVGDTITLHHHVYAPLNLTILYVLSDWGLKEGFVALGIALERTE